MLATTKTIIITRAANVMKYVAQNFSSKILSDIRRALSKEEHALTDFERRQLSLQKWTLVAIVLTLGCYCWLASLQVHANVANDKAFRYSRLPWITVDDPTVQLDASGTIQIRVVLENHTSNPVLHLTEDWTFQNIQIANNVTRRNETENISIMPASQQVRIIKMRGENIQAIFAALNHGDAEIICRLRFTDLGRDKLGIIFKIKFGEAAQAFVINDLETVDDYTKL